MKAIVVVLVLFLSCTTLAQDKAKTFSVYLTVDCSDTVGSNAASALRERIRGSNGYTLAYESTKDHSGYEIILTCAAIPGHEKDASAVSYVFDTFLPDGARYFVQPGIGIVGTIYMDGWARNVFSQFDSYVSDVQKAIAR
jgi:hypothetical protein